MTPTQRLTSTIRPSSWADKGFPLRRMSEGYALVLMRQMREGKFSTQDAEFGSQRSLKGSSMVYMRSTLTYKRT